MSSKSTDDPPANNNVWASLPVPLCDIFVQEIAPQYLTVEDLIRLSGLSRRYRELFRPTNSSSSSGCSCSSGTKILQAQLLRDSSWNSTVKNVRTPHYRTIHQLPTIGSLTPEESIREDPLLVAQLRNAALRRRALVHIRLFDTTHQNSDSTTNATTNAADQQEEENNNSIDYYEPLDVQLHHILSQHKAKRDTDIMRIARMYHVPPRANTEFLCINRSDRDVWCHFIDHSGRLAIRDGDGISSMTQVTQQQNDDYLSSFVVPPDGRLPQNVFRHISALSHAFGFCWQEGGPPFLIYQQNRSWHRTTTRGVTMPIHAIALHPGGVVEELQCGSTFTFDRGGWFTAGLYQFVDRNTGQRFATGAAQQPLQQEEVVVAMNPRRQEQSAEEDHPADEQQQAEQQPHAVQQQSHAEQHAEQQQPTTNANEETLPPMERAKELAKTFYGLHVPSIEHECWLGLGGAQEVLGDPADPLNHPTAISAAIHHHDKLQQQQQ
ncbi:expressed unknown protein [Seminavis robusta]|uniref:Uncharacterized protein n=1 Tax=Seminavis robusta TaxID=568900 RepID=A0A9N8HRB0_9STRA|nr:expressed unknown protein [Seminavis robusta]|eukprot:Sro1376_g267430.1 n/a (493) ;mRNA; r:5989-7584